MECSWNDGSKTKYYLVIFDQLQGHSGGLIQAPESYVRGPLCKGDWAQGSPGESSVNITVSSYDTTHLQENPQRLG